MIDISLYLDENTTPWPGDTPVRLTQNLLIEEGATVNLGSITTSLHNGTHVDAPFHVQRDGASIDRVPLAPYVGPCVVVDVRGVMRVEEEDVRAADLQPGDRVLFRTRTDEDDGRWRDENAHVSVESVIACHMLAVPLIGIDGPSVDPSTSKSLEAHHALVERGIAILENLDLRGVEAGRYVLIALPLKIGGMDASPVRAVLAAEQEWKALAP